MKRLVFYTLLFAGFSTLAFPAQQGNKSADTPPANANFVGDDDGGLAEIVPADPARLGPRSSEAVPVMKSVQQVSIFLGAAWGDHQARTRQIRLPDFGLNPSEPALTELQNHNVEVLPAATRVEDFSDLSKGPVNDLTIQRKLVEMLGNHVIPPPAANTIYVIFLAPGITSTIGASKAGVDYAAYHNLLHLDMTEVRYAVVPYQENADRHNAAALQVFVNTAFNPTGGPKEHVLREPALTKQAI
jgi:hypothetical protein